MEVIIIIRTQDRQKLIPITGTIELAENITTLLEGHKFSPTGDIVGNYLDMEYHLGSYESIAKALDIINQIADAIESNIKVYEMPKV